MPNPTAQYPFDPTGQAGTNLITNENQILTPPDWSDFYFIVPTATPFFANSQFKAVLKPSNKVLVEGVDFNFTHHFYDASKQSAAPVYGSITFLDRTLTGVIELTYQTLGGDWTLNSSQIANLLANVLMNPRTTTWEEVVDVPYQFPPIDHAWDVKDMTGMGDVTDAINQIVVALEATSDITLTQHLSDFNNPHKVNAFQVGLGKVNNWPVATEAQAEGGLAANAYMTPGLVAKAITAQALAAINLHKVDVSNPHQVTKAQIGLGLVGNYAFATTQEALDGVSTTSYMSPALTSTMIANLSGQSITSHLADHNNPHQVTKTQIGLSNVQNYPVATIPQAINGVSDNLYMTPLNTASVINGKLNSVVIPHINDVSNPHQVTAAQIGLELVENFAPANDVEAAEGTRDDLYVSPKGIRSFLDENFIYYFSDNATTVGGYFIYPEVRPMAEEPTADQTDPISEALKENIYFLDGPTWTKIAECKDGTTYYPITVLIYGGVTKDIAKPPVFMLTINMTDGGYYELKQLAGEKDEVIQLYYSKGTENTVNIAGTPATIPATNRLFIYSDNHRNKINVKTIFDSKGIIQAQKDKSTQLITVSKFSPLTNPEEWNNFKANSMSKLSVQSADKDKLVNPPYNGQVNQGISINRDLSNLTYYDNFTNVFPVEFMRVIEQDPSGLTFWQTPVDYSKQIHYFDPLAAYDHEPLFAANRNIWAWDELNGQFTGDNSSKALQALITNHEVFSDEYCIEVELSSTAGTGDAIGLCLGYFEYGGETVGLYAMRNTGFTNVAAANSELANHSQFGLFTIGLNLFQSTAQILSASDVGLTWGDGVSGDSLRDLSVNPFDVNSATNGWNSNGSVRIKFTLQGNIATFETTEFNSSIYVASAKVTMDLTTSPIGKLFANGKFVGGRKWGFGNFNQVQAGFKVINAPDQYPRYIHRVVNADGSDGSTLHAYVGDPTFKVSGWDSISNLELPPGQMIKDSDSNNLWVVRKDSTLEELFPGLNNSAILTT